ncbi:hypothetical protein QBC47DRAFT_399692 [Echria macrotheca]|uniref:Uncharacterized protein n=1 Tax=Echria macrotheca TaxID=438768 RepID=A0AAJ0BFL2_9PEZI|nr:hypothetical protein QBC47DRAFT_399692 [Echria macrotheca]
MASASASGLAGKGGGGSRMPYPEKLLIYHAGTGRTTFLACLKVTTLFVFIFFNFLAAPSYIQADEDWYKTAGIILCGTIPLAFVAYSSAAFVSTMTLHLPPFARSSTEMLKRFVANVPPTTRLDIVTMSFIGKPRTTALRVGEMRAVDRRLGMVNFVRDTAGENATRRWWEFRAVGKFHVQTGRNEKVLKNGWVWSEVAGVIRKRGGGGGEKL